MPDWRLRQIFRSQDTLAQLLFACVFGLVLGGMAVVTSPVVVAAGLGAVLGGLIVVKRPEIAVLAFVGAFSTILDVDILPLVNIGVGSLNICDVVLIALLAVILLRALVERDFRFARTSLNLPLIAFYGMAVLATVVALINHSVDQTAAVREMRYITYYFAFFVVTNLVYGTRQLDRLVQGFFALAGGVALAMIIQFVVGPSTPFIYGRVENFAQDGNVVSEVTRIIPAGRYLLSVAFNIATLYLIMHRPLKLLTVAYWLLLLVGMVLMFSRNTWVGTALVVGGFALVAHAQYRRQLLSFTLVSLIGLAGLLALTPVVPSTPLEKTLASLSGRVISIFDARTYTEQINTNQNTSSLEFRRIENEYALPLITPPSLIGLGMGANYRPTLSQLDGETFDGRAYIHNAHLWILIKVGAVGYVALIAFFLLGIIRGLRSWQRMPTAFYQAFILGSSLTTIAMLASAIVDPLLVDLSWTPVCSVMLGVTELLIRRYVNGNSNVITARISAALVRN